MSSPELVELERRVDLAMKGMKLLLFGEARQSQYLARRRESFRSG